jgi:hypothetical protein
LLDMMRTLVKGPWKRGSRVGGDHLLEDSSFAGVSEYPRLGACLSTDSFASRLERSAILVWREKEE